MATYSAQPSPPDRAKAIAAVALIHAGLAAVILSGLNVRTVERAVEHLKAFDIREVEPPPPPPPPAQSERARDEAGAPAKRAQPTPVVAPPPKIVVPAKPPIVAAPIAGTGSAPRAGATVSGSGTGADGIGTGLGGGGSGSGDGRVPAQLLNKIPDREYRRISNGRMPRGNAAIGMRVDPDGRASNCRIVRSSGDPYVDGNLCPLVTNRLRFRPARDDQGR
ncbi:MAG: hypothetical protein ABIP91_00455, partial [Sphingomicrobium sp.]